MNTPSLYLFPLTDNPIVNGLTNGTNWVLDSNRTLTWGVSDFASFHWANVAAAESTIGAAYAAFEPYINLKFAFGGQFSDPGFATTDLVVTGDQSGVFFNSPYVIALGFFPNASLDYAMEPAGVQGNYPTAPGDVWLNANSPLSYSGYYGPGSGAFETLLHEIGHTLGLKHPHDDGGTGRPTFSNLGFTLFDQDWFTVMSYNDTYSFTTPLWHPATPMIGDVIALQYIYGPNLSTNAGDSTFTLGNNNLYQTIFDPSGRNALNFGTSSQSWNINLAIVSGGTYDHIGYDIGFAAPIQNLSAPTSFYWLYGSFQSVIGSPQADVISGGPASEVLNGGGGNDQITAGGGNDSLTGGAGNDQIDGGTGRSVAYLSGIAASYSTWTNGSIRYMQGQDGTDAYTNVERFHFDNANVAYDVDGDAGEAYRLYQAAFDRTPDVAGLGFWINALDEGYDLHQVAGFFLASSEFAQKYGTNLDAQQFVTQLYANVLHRAPDAGGAAFWESALDQNQITRADALAFFSESTENQANVIGAIQNGIVYIV